MERVLGLDVSKDNVMACLLTELPEPSQFYLDDNFTRLYANTEGIKRLLAFNPDVAVMEPTGVNYTKIWATKLAEAGIKVVLVGHKQLSIFRSTLGINDKDDEADSLALACYYLQYKDFPRRFVRYRAETVTHMRELSLRLNHLSRIQSPIINRLRQDLAWAFPERCKTQLTSRLFWRWLAQEAKSAKYDLQLKESCGLGLNDHILFNAQLLNNLLEREDIVERELRECLSDAQFLPYRKVMARYGLGDRTQALIIAQIYPLQNFLGPDGKPIVLESKGKTSGKPTLKRLSLRRFTSSLGCSPMREWSGDKKKSKKAGSELCRTAFWQWIFTRIEIKRLRLKNERFSAIAEEYDRLRIHKPTKLARSKTAALATKRLFYDLFYELFPDTEVSND